MRATAVPVLVQQLLDHEAEQARNQQNEQYEQRVVEGLPEAVHRACEKLRVHLSIRIGRDGFRTLLARALTLAAVQFPQLSAVRVTPDGTLEGRIISSPGNPPSHPQGEDEEARDETMEGAEAIFTHLLELLVTFIGYALTRRMLSTLWPQIDLPELWGNKGMDTNTGTEGTASTTPASEKETA